MYVNYGIGQTPQCMECRRKVPDLQRPLSLYCVGTQYEQSRYKVLFVGKAAVGGQEGEPYNNLFSDATQYARDLYDGWYSQFWRRLHEIADELYEENAGWENIALTNFVKCNNGSQQDKSTWTMRCNCADVLRKELELLTPEHIVFFTNSSYDENTEMVFDEIKDSQYPQSIRPSIRLRTFTGIYAGREAKVLRCGHPQCKPKEEFVRQVVDFIRA